jgi:hypothetical protein
MSRTGRVQGRSTLSTEAPLGQGIESGESVGSLRWLPTRSHSLPDLRTQVRPQPPGPTLLRTGVAERQPRPHPGAQAHCHPASGKAMAPCAQRRRMTERARPLLPAAQSLPAVPPRPTRPEPTPPIGRRLPPTQPAHGAVQPARRRLPAPGRPHRMNGRRCLSPRLRSGCRTPPAGLWVPCANARRSARSGSSGQPLPGVRDRKGKLIDCVAAFVLRADLGLTRGIEGTEGPLSCSAAVTVNFSGFAALLDRIVAVLDPHAGLKTAPLAVAV